MSVPVPVKIQFDDDQLDVRTFGMGGGAKWGKGHWAPKANVGYENKRGRNTGLGFDPEHPARWVHVDNGVKDGSGWESDGSGSRCSACEDGSDAVPTSVIDGSGTIPLADGSYGYDLGTKGSDGAYKKKRRGPGRPKGSKNKKRRSKSKSRSGRRKRKTTRRSKSRSGRKRKSTRRSKSKSGRKRKSTRRSKSRSRRNAGCYGRRNSGCYGSSRKARGKGKRRGPGRPRKGSK